MESLITAARLTDRNESNLYMAFLDHSTCIRRYFLKFHRSSCLIGVTTYANLPVLK